MPEQWRIRVQRLPRYGLPVIWARLNGLYEVRVVVSSGEPTTAIAPDVERASLQESLRGDGPDERRRPPRGRRVIPSDVGPLIAQTLRLSTLELFAVPGGWRSWGPLVVAVTGRPQVLGVGGLLGVDFLARFRRVTYELGPPDTLLLDEDA